MRKYLKLRQIQKQRKGLDREKTKRRSSSAASPYEGETAKEKICFENTKFSKTENFSQMKIKKVFRNALPVLPEMLP